MKVLIEKTLSQSTLVEIPDNLPEGRQQEMAAELADKMPIYGDCEWCGTDFFRTAKEGEDLDPNEVHGHTVDELPLVTWFDVS